MVEDYAILFDKNVLMCCREGLKYEYEEVYSHDVIFLEDAFPKVKGMFDLQNEIIEYSNYDYIVIRNIEALENTLNQLNEHKIRVLEFIDCIIVFPQKMTVCSKCFLQRYVEGLDLKYFPSQVHVTQILSFNYELQWKYIVEGKEGCLTDVDSMSVFYKDKWSKSDEKFLGYPKCECFRAISVEKITEDNTVSTGHRSLGVKNLDNFVGRLCPIVSIENLSSVDGNQYPVYGSMSASTISEKIFSYHGGKGQTNKQARNSALGEALERYSSRKFNYDELLLCSERDMLEKHLSFLRLSELYPFSSEKLHLKEVEWCKGENKTNGNKIYIPANVVYFPYEAEPELHFTIQSTTGLASGVTIDDAILQGLLELIERHYYTIAFKTNDTQLIIKDILFETNNPQLEELQKQFIFHLTLLNEAELNCFVVHCVLEYKFDDQPKYTHGSGAALDLRTAIYRAIFEALQLRTSQLILFETDQIYDEVNLAYLKWAEGIEQDYFEILLNNKGRDSVKVVDDITKKLRPVNIIDSCSSLINQLEHKGIEVYSIDLSRKDVPLKCVRILAPKLQDIDNEFVKVTPILKKIGIRNNRMLFS